MERRAIATLLYDESFVDGALALGASVQTHLDGDVDLVTLATSGVPRGARQRLASGGWALHDVLYLGCEVRLGARPGRWSEDVGVDDGASEPAVPVVGRRAVF